MLISIPEKAAQNNIPPKWEQPPSGKNNSG